MIVYHGTKRAKAKKILEIGFRHSKYPSYTGTGTCLTDCMTIAYEYGAYESGGCVLAVELDDEAKIHELNQFSLKDTFWAANPEAKIVSLCGGNVIVLWDNQPVKSVKILDKSEALSLLVDEFNINGENMAYNGMVEDYHNLYRGSGDFQCLSDSQIKSFQKLAKSRNLPGLVSA